MEHNEAKSNGSQSTNKKLDAEVSKREVNRIRTLRENVLLLRYHIARRADIDQLLDPTDRLATELALKSSLEVIEQIEDGQYVPTGHVASTASTLMSAVDKLVHAARLAQDDDGTGEKPLLITPESLRASMSPAEIDDAIGVDPAGQLGSRARRHRSEARVYIQKKTWQTFLLFVLALGSELMIVHGETDSSQTATTADKAAAKSGDSPSADTMARSVNLRYFKTALHEDVVIPVSAFLWALVGSFVWLLMRFRRFGAAFAFNPEHAKVHMARILSGAVVSAVLLYFVFGGDDPWAENWPSSLPLWAFVIGYAGKLQVKLLNSFVTNIESRIGALGQRRPPAVGKPAPNGGSSVDVGDVPQFTPEAPADGDRESDGDRDVQSRSKPNGS